MPFCEALCGVPGTYYYLLWVKSQSEAGGRCAGLSCTPEYTSTETILRINLLLRNRRFIARFAKIAAPLYRLTKKEVKWEWSKECQLAFETLKDKLMQAPVLIYPDFEEKFVLETDASLRGLGAVLSQKKDGLLHPVSYATRSLSSPEKNYSISEL